MAERAAAHASLRVPRMRKDASKADRVVKVSLRLCSTLRSDLIVLIDHPSALSATGTV
jgi:hypothetical protein